MECANIISGWKIGTGRKFFGELQAFIGMSEVRWNQCGQLTTTKGQVMYWSGMPNEADIHQYGVGVLVNNRFRNVVIDYKFVNERIMTTRLKGHYKNLTVILNDTLEKTDKTDLKILMGDFNAKVGSDNAEPCNGSSWNWYDERQRRTSRGNKVNE